MSFTFKPAKRDSGKALIGLCGSSGSGKTMSALRLATGLGGPICLIDTEAGRAAMYAEDFKFMHGIMSAPFTPVAYVEAVEAAVRLQPNVIIIDSMSHEWEGVGGILEAVDTAKANSRDQFGVWAKPKAAHNKLVQRLLQIPAHAILCMRAKPKKIVGIDEKTQKKEIVDGGWHPICESGLTYELTVNLLLSTANKGCPDFEQVFDYGKLPTPMKGLFAHGVQIDESTGRMLAAWLSGGEYQPRVGIPVDRDLVVDDTTGEVTTERNPARPPAELYRADGATLGSFASYGQLLTWIEEQAPADWAPIIADNDELLQWLLREAPVAMRERVQDLLANSLDFEHPETTRAGEAV